MVPNLSPPPIPPSGKFQDREMAKWATEAWRWMNLVYGRLGSGSVLPVSLGGTGTTTVAETVANQAASSSNTGSGTALTQSKTGQSLTSPAVASPGEFADKTISWDVPFADSNYTLTWSRRSGTYGEVTLVSNDAAGATFRLTVLDSDFRIVHGEELFVIPTATVDMTGVHA